MRFDTRAKDKTNLDGDGDRDRPAGETLELDAFLLPGLLLPLPGGEPTPLLLLSIPDGLFPPSFLPPPQPLLALTSEPVLGEALLEVAVVAAAAAAVTDFGDPTDEGVRTAATPMAAGSENDPEPPGCGATTPHPDSVGAADPIDPMDSSPIDIGRRSSAAPSHADTFSSPSPTPVLAAAASMAAFEAAAVPGRESARRSSAAARPLLRMDPTRAACLWRCCSLCARAALALAWVWILTAASVSRWVDSLVCRGGGGMEGATGGSVRC